MRVRAAGAGDPGALELNLPAARRGRLRQAAARVGGLHRLRPLQRVARRPQAVRRPRVRRRHQPDDPAQLGPPADGREARHDARPVRLALQPQQPLLEPRLPWLRYQARVQSVLGEGTPVFDVLYFLGDQLPQSFVRNASTTLPAGYTVDAVNAEILSRARHGGRRPAPAERRRRRRAAEPAAAASTVARHAEAARGAGPRRCARLRPEADRPAVDGRHARVGRVPSAGRPRLGRRRRHRPCSATRTARAAWRGAGRSGRCSSAGAWPSAVRGEPRRRARLPVRPAARRRQRRLLRREPVGPRPRARVLVPRRRVGAGDLGPRDRRASPVPRRSASRAAAAAAGALRAPSGADLRVPPRPAGPPRHLDRTGRHRRCSRPRRGAPEVPGAPFDEPDGLAVVPATSGALTLDDERRPALSGRFEAPRDAAGRAISTAPLELRGPGVTAAKTIEITGLRSLTEFDAPEIRYFSGEATYRLRFRVPKPDAGRGDVLLLDVGDFESVADVTLNGTPLGRLWRPGAALDVTGTPARRQRARRHRREHVPEPFHRRPRAVRRGAQPPHLVADPGLPLPRRAAQALRPHRPDHGHPRPAAARARAVAAARRSWTPGASMLPTMLHTLRSPAQRSSRPPSSSRRFRTPRLRERVPRRRPPPPVPPIRSQSPRPTTVCPAPDRSGATTGSRELGANAAARARSASSRTSTRSCSSATPSRRAGATTSAAASPA